MSIVKSIDVYGNRLLETNGQVVHVSENPQESQSLRGEDEGQRERSFSGEHNYFAEVSLTWTVSI